MPKCKYDYPEDDPRPRTCPLHGLTCPGPKQYTNTREPGEFGDGATVERDDESVVAKNATTASADKMEVKWTITERHGEREKVTRLVDKDAATRIITACQQEVERLRREIDHKQKAMSSQAEQWTRSMAEAKREGMEAMSPLVERAFRDGLSYGTICDVVDQDEAWRISSVRQKAQTIIDPTTMN